MPIISYRYYGNADLRVAHCADVACTTATTATVHVDGTTPWHTSITIGVDGLPIISYYDSGNRDLRVAHCSNTFCTPQVRRR